MSDFLRSRPFGSVKSGTRKMNDRVTLALRKTGKWIKIPIIW
jgi:hypothetical protein